MQTLIDAFLEEDSLLRQRLTTCPRKFRDVRGNDNTLSFKETLGHIAFWDDYTVQFFGCRLDATSCDLIPPADFESRNKAALAATRCLPFGEVLARYLEATGALIEFLRQSWSRLDERDRQNFWIPLKHRRHHRLELFKALDDLMASDVDALAAEA